MPAQLEPPRVAVMIPAYNGQRTLRRTLESIVDQSFTSWEVVVADDASSDRTWDIIEEYATRYPVKVRGVRRERNGGTAAARNSALEATSATELIALLDQDDFWLPQYLDRQVGAYDAAIAAGRRPGIVCCNAYLAQPNGDRAGTYDQIVGWRDRITYEDMIPRSRIFVSALFPRAALDEVGTFAADCPHSNDYDLWLRIMEAGYDVVPSREPLVVYQLHPDNMSASAVRMADAVLAVYERALARPTPTPKQRRAMKRAVRQYTAVRERALIREAWARGDRSKPVLRGLRLLPAGLLVLLQTPSRWPDLGLRLIGRSKRLRPSHIG